MASDVVSLSLGDLIRRLHNAIMDFVGAIDETIRQDRSVSVQEIRTLRDHIRQRIQANESPEDNKQLLKILDLFSSNSAVIELIREDAEDWLKFLDDIEKSMERRDQSGSLSDYERKELMDIKRLTGEIKAILRK
ncbi:MAG: hypothetical protein M1160_03495 [Candidatus Marsarchaeota archaeon]|jgi:hypothetical protein|nr:hypothetical protein [Candidatus Marsarchaeota archaeon]MCL5111909.1 hypothetical protein [Candidatus Marsarchaeota archaeon]